MTTRDLDRRLLRFRSRRDEYPHALASALLDAGRPKEALEVIHLGLLDDESDGALRTLEGRAFYEQGELHEAQAALLRAAKANPKDKEPYRWLAQVLVERGDPTRALQVLERALAIDPHDARLQRAYARAERLESGLAAPVESAPIAPAPRTREREPRAPRGLFGSEPGDERMQHDQRAERGPQISEHEPTAAYRPHLPYDEETDRDDEMPTLAVELTDDMRELLRGSSAPAPMFPASSPDEDEEGSEMTSIVPAAEELELVRHEQRLARARARELDDPGTSDDEADKTVVDFHPPLAQPGEAEPPEEVLALLQAQGVFESRSPSAPPPGWARGNEVPRTAMSMTRALALGWLLAVAGAAGGYFGFQKWLGARRTEAASLVASARTGMLGGQHAALVSAEKQLTEARSLDPKSLPALETLLLAQGTRVLEEGSRDELGALRETLGRAAQAPLATPLVDALQVLVLPPEQREARIDALVERADREAARDPGTAYVVGRLAQRAAKPEAAKRLLGRAVALEPAFAPAWIALGEQARAEGRLAEAHMAFEKAGGPEGRALRAELWLMVLDAKPNRGRELLQQVEALAPRIVDAAESDQLFAWTVRAHALLSSGEHTKAKEALHAAGALRVDDPELLAFLSEQAQRGGEHALAYRAARAASRAGGSAPRYQALVAATLLQQRDGDSALESLGEGHGTLALARAGAALLTNAREPLEHAKKELASYRASAAGREDVDASSLLMRVDLRLGANVESLMPAARALAQRAPNAVSAQLALGEALIGAEQGASAAETLERALKINPGAADAHFLLGRARRLLGRHNEARESFEHAVAIAPNHTEARRALGQLLLESGEYDAALALFRELQGAGVPASALGIGEALLGKGDLAGAAAQFDALEPAVKALPSAELAEARLLLARGDAATALETLASLIEEEADTRTAEALALHAEALYASDRLEPAASSFDAALELDGGHPDALIGRALVAARMGKADAALSLVERADAALSLRARPSRSRALLMIATAQAELLKQQLQSARTRLARAITLPGAPAEAHFWYAEALVKSHMEGASEQYAKYLALAPSGAYALRAKRALATR